MKRWLAVAAAVVVTILLNDLPQQTPRAVQLHVSDVGATAIAGNLGGRCPNTLLGNFRLTRWP